MNHKTWPILFMGLLVVALSAAGCARGIATGGGTIPSVYPDTRGATTANFGFWGDSCGDTTSGNFNYHDKSVYNDQKAGGLKMVGPVQRTCDCMQYDEDDPDDCSDLCLTCWYVAAYSVGECLDDAGSVGEGLACLEGFPGYLTGIEAYYYSTNPKYPGEGEVSVCVADYGEGHNADSDDQLFLFVDGGPYDGYQNGGNVRGNIQAYPCPN